MHGQQNIKVSTYVQLNVLESVGNLIVAQLLNKLSAFYETQNITAVMAKPPTTPVQSQMNLVYTLPPYSFTTRFNIPSHLGLGVQCGLFVWGTLIPFVLHMCHNNRPFHPLLFHHSSNIIMSGEECIVRSSHYADSCGYPLLHLYSKHILQHPVHEHPPVSVLRLMWETSIHIYSFIQRELNTLKLFTQWRSIMWTSTVHQIVELPIYFSPDFGFWNL